MAGKIVMASEPSRQEIEEDTQQRGLDLAYTEGAKLWRDVALACASNNWTHDCAVSKADEISVAYLNRRGIKDPMFPYRGGGRKEC